MGIVYRIDGPTNIPAESKTYVGITTGKLTKRWHQYKAEYKQHLYSGKGRQIHIAFEKYGFDNFKIIEIETCDDNILSEREIHWIKELNTLHPNGLNSHTGGVFHNHTDGTREKISQLKKPDVSKDLPMYINYNIRDDNPKKIRHGYNIFHVPSNKRLRVMVPINEPITPEMLETAKEYLKSLVDAYNITISDGTKELSVPTVIPPASFKRNEKSEGMPMYINYYKNNYNGKSTRHGYRINHVPSKTRKCVNCPINEELTSEMLETAKVYLAEIVDKHNKKLADEAAKKLADQSAEKVIKDLENLSL